MTKVDDYTVLVSFKKPTPFWATAFVAAEGGIIPKHLFGPYAGAKSREAPTNLKPVGTGPYTFVDFKPGDIVLGAINKNYHMPNRPFFDTIEMKGGGDATSAARAVLQTGEYDYAWNLQVEDEVLKRMEAGGKGKVAHRPGRRHRVHPVQHHRPVERGRRRARQRQEQALRVQRPEGARGDGAALRQEEHAGLHLRPHGLRDRQLHEQPRALPLEEHQVGVQRRQGERASSTRAGWKRGADGIREKGGKKMKFVYQTSINATRQKEQAIVKQAAQKAGIDLELKSVTASVFFSSDFANPDTYQKFWADMQMYTTTMTAPDAERFMDQYKSDEISQKANKWSGRNICRYVNPEYDKLLRRRRRPSSIRSSGPRCTSR